MWKIFLFSVLVIFIGGFQQINSLEDNVMPVQSLSWNDTTLKERLDALQSQFEEQLQMLKSLADNKKEDESRSMDCVSSYYPSDCAEALVRNPQSGIHSIRVDRYGPNNFLVYCDATTQGGGWTVIQRRRDGTIDFFRKWSEYKHGFGNLNGEFFIGLDKLHALTNDRPQELLIVMEDFDNVIKYAKYDSFAIGNESEDYALNVLGSYSGDAGDSFTEHASFKFSTVDRDNDVDVRNCADVFKGAWWYRSCHTSNLNGFYLYGEYGEDRFGQGVNWFAWRGFYYSLKTVQMFIRPKRN